MNVRPIIIGVSSTIALLGMVLGAQAVSSRFVNNNLKLYGEASNPDGYFTIGDNTQVTGKLNVKGTVSDSNSDLMLDDSVIITGDTIVEGGAEIKGEIYNSNDVVTVNDDLAVTGLFSINSMVTPTTATCDTDGGLSYDTTYLYLCVAGSWKKVALQTL